MASPSQTLPRSTAFSIISDGRTLALLSANFWIKTYDPNTANYTVSFLRNLCLLTGAKKLIQRSERGLLGA